ncbi:hypothetical protein ESA94_15395 [Lacibacter luteus]|uniref:Carboxypeptidase regulatory-like domain-containing protein n=1 Tax=Lacibacter luteus TaxID=2508719 RepID=A0A4Q1CFK0_9BACT|nr:hypothetical protein [Lacibacter luteus]RXK58773.1 hypothetical protein ESA94_15395 [Lacibacter luteus]
MKQLNFVLLMLFFALTVHAQIPDAINYQAVARNTSGQALANQSIKVRLSFVRGTTTLYSETRNVTTNALGLFNVQIGSAGATSASGDFAAIYWLNNTPAIMLKVELDVNNSGVFTEMGTQTLATVPYAYAAKKSIDAVNLGGRYVDDVTAPNNGDVMLWNAAENRWKPGVAATASSSAPTITNLAGFIAPIVPSAQWAFFPSSGNTTTTITITKPTTIVASATATLGHSNTGQTALDVSIMPAYQLTSGAGGIVTIFNPGNFPAANIANLRVPFSASSSVTLTTPGTYKIGFAIRNNTSLTLNNNDWLSGYIMIYQ